MKQLDGPLAGTAWQRAYGLCIANGRTVVSTIDGKPGLIISNSAIDSAISPL